jgi:hypothetical protein
MSAARWKRFPHGERSGRAVCGRRELEVADETLYPGELIGSGTVHRLLAEKRERLIDLRSDFRPSGEAEGGLLDSHRPDWMALLVIGREDGLGGSAANDLNQLGGQIVRVLNAGVCTEAANRRRHVCGITGEEDPAVAVARCGPR